MGRPDVVGRLGRHRRGPRRAPRPDRVGVREDAAPASSCWSPTTRARCCPSSTRWPATSSARTSPRACVVKARVPAAVAHRFAEFAVNGATRRRPSSPITASARISLRRVELPVRLLSDAATLPTRANEGDAGLDLYAPSPPSSAPAIGPRSAPASPSRSRAGHAGLVLPRSGLAARHGIALVNSPGLIDSGYRGRGPRPAAQHGRERAVRDRCGRSHRPASGDAVRGRGAPRGRRTGDECAGRGRLRLERRLAG